MTNKISKNQKLANAVYDAIRVLEDVVLAAEKAGMKTNLTVDCGQIDASEITACVAVEYEDQHALDKAQSPE